MTLPQILPPAALAATLTFCQPAHADQVIWINDNAGNLVGQVAVTGQVAWIYDGAGRPVGNATLPARQLRAPETAFYPAESPLRQPRGLRHPPAKSWRDPVDVFENWD